MKRTLIIIGSVVAILIMLFFIFFELKDVPDIKTGASYDVEEKDTGGLFVFYKMLKYRYGEINTDLIIADDFKFLTDRENTLLVTVNKSIGLDSSSISILGDFLAKGNEVIIIGRKFDLNEYPWGSLLQTYAKRDTIFRLEWNDGVSYLHDPIDFNGFNPMSNYQSISYFNTDNYTPNYNSSIEPIVSNKDLLHFLDTLCIFRKVNFGSNAIHFHSAPELFINSATASEDYLTNFNKTLSTFGSDKVIMHKFKRNNLNAGANEDSLIQYILSQRSLKFAYYLTILMGLIYVFFSSKRKQKVIPIIEESKNTSLEYINTMSAIFMAQKQNEKLVKHMKRNFFHKMKMAYFLNADDPNFAEKLSKKSKVPIAQINKIIKQFSWVDSYKFNDDQLIRLYNDVNSFYQIRK